MILYCGCISSWFAYSCIPGTSYHFVPGCFYIMQDEWLFPISVDYTRGTHPQSLNLTPVSIKMSADILHDGHVIMKNACCVPKKVCVCLKGYTCTRLTGESREEIIKLHVSNPKFVQSVTIFVFSGV